MRHCCTVGIVVVLPMLLLGIACTPESVPQGPFYGPMDATALPGQDSMTRSMDAGVRTDGMDVNDAGLFPEPDADIPLPSQCDPLTWSTEQITFRLTCGDSELGLLPGIHANGEWREPSACEALEDGTIQCHFNELGRLRLRTQSTQVLASYTADFDQVFGGHRLVGSAYLPEATAWLSNGLHTWSQSGVIRIPVTMTDGMRQTALEAQNDVEAIRDGRANSWWHTFIQAETSLVLGALSAHQFRSWISVTGLQPSLQIQIASGGTGEALNLPSGRTIQLETWSLSMGPNINDLLDAYGRQLVGRSPRKSPTAGWSSWYALWDDVAQDSVLSNANLVRRELGRKVPESALPLTVVVEEGWQNAWGDWRANDRFPDGFPAVVSDLSDMGLNAGFWIAPLLFKSSLPIVQDNPGWFLDGVDFNHLRLGEMKVLDVTHPGAAEYLGNLIQQKVDDGFTLLKLDYLYAGAMEAQRFEPSTGLAAYNRALEIIREAAGSDTLLVGVGAFPIASFDRLDSWRWGPDVAQLIFGPDWYFIAQTARSAAARWPYCRAINCDADPIVMSGLPENEARAAVWASALGGGAFYLSDDLAQYSADDFEMIHVDAVFNALSGEPAIPIPVPSIIPQSLSSTVSDRVEMTNRQYAPSVWTLPDGRTLIVNWADSAEEINGTRYPGRSATIAP